MSILNDPGMKEVVDDFVTESEQLFAKLEDILDEMEDDPSIDANFEKFGQTIDRVMGAAATLGADQISKFCELGKIIGYKASQSQYQQLRSTVIAVLYDAVDLLKKMLSQIKSGDDTSLKELNTNAFMSRLKWLSEKFKDIQRSSVAFDESEVDANPEEVEAALKKVGIS